MHNVTFAKVKMKSLKSVLTFGGGIDKIFDPYFTTKHKAQGAGLGLYMTKTIVEQNMGGTVDIKNDNDGVVCTIKLMRGQSC